MCKRFIYSFSFVCVLGLTVGLASVEAAGPVAMEAELYDAIAPADSNEFEFV